MSDSCVPAPVGIHTSAATYYDIMIIISQCACCICAMRIVALLHCYIITHVWRDNRARRSDLLGFSLILRWFCVSCDYLIIYDDCLDKQELVFEVL